MRCYRYGREDSCPSPRHSRTVRETFTSHGSSDDESLSWIPLSVDFVMTVTMRNLHGLLLDRCAFGGERRCVRLLATVTPASLQYVMT